MEIDLGKLEELHKMTKHCKQPELAINLKTGKWLEKTKDGSYTEITPLPESFWRM